MQLEILSVFRTFLQATNFKNFIRTSLAYVMHMLCFRKKHMRKLNIWHISDVYFHLRKDSLREKCPKTEFFLVRIFPHSDWIRRDTPYTLYLSVFSPKKIRTRKNSVFRHFSRSVLFINGALLPPDVLSKVFQQIFGKLLNPSSSLLVRTCGSSSKRVSLKTTFEKCLYFL